MNFDIINLQHLISLVYEKTTGWKDLNAIISLVYETANIWNNLKNRARRGNIRGGTPIT